MFKHIYVPVDNSDYSNRAVDLAVEIGRAFGSPAEMGRLFLTDHLLAFEITSIVLLVAAVGGVVLGMRSEDEALVDAGRGGRA